MAGPKYIAMNLLGTATVTAPGGTATGYAVANLYAHRVSKTWTSNIKTAGQRINVDHSSAVDADTCALHNHNLPVGSSVIVQGHSVAPPASGAWSGATNLGTFTVRAGDMHVALSSLSVRYRSIYLENDGGAAWTVEPKIGEAVIGTAAQLTRAFRWGNQITANANQIRHVTPNGHVWLARRAPKSKVFALSWQTLTFSQQVEIETFHTATADAAIPFTVIPYPDVATHAAQVYYVDMDPALAVTDIHTANKSASLTLREQVREVVLS